jgi:hypothetical protein
MASNGTFGAPKRVAVSRSHGGDDFRIVYHKESTVGKVEDRTLRSSVSRNSWELLITRSISLARAWIAR